MQDTSIRDQNISFLNSCMRLPLYLDESQTTNKRIFCVDGASGCTGGAIVERLLIAGNTVHGTICSNPQDTRYDPMRSMDGAKDRIHLFLADVSKKESFDEAICGCDVVIRVASPVSVRAQVEVSRPAVEGVENALDAIKKSGEMFSLVYTGSLSGGHRG